MVFLSSYSFFIFIFSVAAKTIENVVISNVINIKTKPVTVLLFM